MEELLRIMSEVRPDIDFATATDLIDDDILDSFDIIYWGYLGGNKIILIKPFWVDLVIWTNK